MTKMSEELDPKHLSIAANCENIMNVAVESRKRFGKACIEYDQKKLIMENKLLNLEVAAVSNYRVKPKTVLTNVDENGRKELEDLFLKINEKQKRMEQLVSLLKNTREVVIQNETDLISKQLRNARTVEAMLAAVKAKANTKQA